MSKLTDFYAHKASLLVPQGTEVVDVRWLMEEE